MRAMKDAGLREVQSLINRSARTYGLGRISQDDHDYIKTRLQEVESRIVNMNEHDPNMKEF
jgi:hypothetical protein